MSRDVAAAIRRAKDSPSRDRDLLAGYAPRPSTDPELDEMIGAIMAEHHYIMDRLA